MNNHIESIIAIVNKHLYVLRKRNSDCLEIIEKNFTKFAMMTGNPEMKGEVNDLMFYHTNKKKSSEYLICYLAPPPLHHMYKVQPTILGEMNMYHCSTVKAFPSYGIFLFHSHFDMKLD